MNISNTHQKIKNLCSFNSEITTLFFHQPKFTIKYLSALLLIMIFANGCTNSIESISTASELVDSTNNQNQQSESSPEEEIENTPTQPKYASWGTGGLNVTKGLVRELQLNNSANSRYYIYIPPNYDESKPMGLVMLFHGVEGTSTPNVFIKMSAYVGEDRFILVSPVGDIDFGGSGAWCQPHSREIQNLVEQKYNIDRRRKYVAAVSGGGLPAVRYALGGENKKYGFCGNSIPSGFQSEFAGFGFTASAYSPSDSEFAGMKGLSASQLGFKPSIWTDYGELSKDQSDAQDLANWGAKLGFKVEYHERPGEGHSPESPYNFMFGMFDMFEATVKPISE